MLVDRNKRCPVFVVDHDIRQADEHALFLINGVGDAIAHGRHQKVARIGAVDRSDLDTDFFPLGHVDLLYG